MWWLDFVKTSFSQSARLHITKENIKFCTDISSQLRSRFSEKFRNVRRTILKSTELGTPGKDLKSLLPWSSSENFPRDNVFRFGKTIFMSLPLLPTVKAPRVSSRKLEYPARFSAKILSRNCTREWWGDRHRSQPDKMEISSWRPFRGEARRKSGLTYIFRILHLRISERKLKISSNTFKFLRIR